MNISLLSFVGRSFNGEHVALPSVGVLADRPVTGVSQARVLTLSGLCNWCQPGQGADTIWLLLLVSAGQPGQGADTPPVLVRHRLGPL